jgi:hypothetical protein
VGPPLVPFHGCGSHNVVVVGSKHSVVPMEVSVKAENADAANEWLDEDGRPRCTGMFWTASAHIVTAVIDFGVLSLAWAIAPLGRVAGPATINSPLCPHHLQHRHAARRVLPHWRPRHGQAQLHVHGRRARQPRRHQGRILRRHPVRQDQPCRRRHRADRMKRHYKGKTRRSANLVGKRRTN